ncbi:MAG TPA: squalene/phytoene synthase family protein [Steroidobacteraceae bacterium]|nr:squalene/phytoene synthase family protein [Steroidobacteraceae bacterium]
MTDDPLKRGTPPGSLRHFAVMYAPASARPLLEALYAYEAEIADTVASSSHEVAHTRLQWWRGEIDRLLGGDPRHPVTRALQPLRDRAGERVALLHEPLVAADIDLARLTFENARELEAYCFRASGALQLLAAHTSVGDITLPDVEQEFARRLGSAVRRTELLRDLRGHLAAGRLPVPLDALARAGVDPHALRADAMTPAFIAVLTAMRDDLRRQLRELISMLEPASRARQRQGLVLAALHGKLLEQIAHGSELARTRAEVPGWTKVWTAWRTALRAA